ncbi:MAG: hypothetical protein Q9218_002537 [Villophora microphyllina]
MESTAHLRSLTQQSHPGVEASLKSLNISKKTPRQQKVGRVADSWDDEKEAVSSSASSDSETATPANESSVPGAPPPTPISPSARSDGAWGDVPSIHSQSAGQSHGFSPTQSPASRPEKTTATAGRMIAGALGIKAPKKSEEERAYERAMREKESKRLSREREERKAEEEKRSQARRQIWED